MALLISYASNGPKAQAELDDWTLDSGPGEMAFRFPDEAAAGDRIAYFIGGKRQEFVATGRVLSDWRKGGRGAWKGHYYVKLSEPRLVNPAIAVEEMNRLTGLPAPKDATLVEPRFRSAVLAALRHQSYDPEARAIEGTKTESTSKKRDPRLRRLAIQRANGVCEGCDTDFTILAGGLGRRCLVVHHTKQLRDTDEPRWTSVKDLAVVCANCHMIIHHDQRQALTLRQLRQKLRS